MDCGAAKLPVMGVFRSGASHLRLPVVKVGLCNPLHSRDVKTSSWSQYDAVFLLTDNIANKLHMQKVSDFVLSPGAQPSKVRSPDRQKETQKEV